MRWCFLLLSCFLVQISMAQVAIDFQFVKPENTLNGKKFSHFNSVKILNHSKESITLNTQIILPKGWKIAPFMPLAESLIIPANDSIFVPVKIVIPKYARGGKTYFYSIKLFDESKKYIGESKASLTIPEVSEWAVELLDEEVYLPSDSSQITFKTRITNKGNKPETISLHYRIQDRIASKRIDIEPGFDSTLTLTAEYAEYANYKAANREYIGITASNGLDVQGKTLYFVKFKNDFNDLRSSRRPNSIGFIYDNLPRQNLSTLGFRATGSMTFQNEAELSYYLSNTDLGNSSQFSRSTVYRLQYLSEQIDIGLGSTFNYSYKFHRINTLSGRRPSLNGNNGLNVTWRPYQHRVHNTTIFVSRNIQQPITTVLGAHRIRLGRGAIEGAFTYNLDFFGKRSLKIGSLSGKFPLGQNHYLEVSGNLVEEAHHLLSIGDNLIDSMFRNAQNVIRDRSFNYRLYYSGRLFKNLNLSIANSYNSPYYPNGERALLNFDVQLSYYLPKRHVFRIGYRYQGKTPYSYQYGFPLPVLGFNRENIFAEYRMPITHFLTLQGGILNQKYTRQRLSNVTTDFATFSSNDYKAFLGLSSKSGNHQVRLNALAGYAVIDDFMDEDGVFYTEIPRIPSFNFQGDYKYLQFRFGVNYTIGPNGTVSQFDDNSTDLYNKNIRLYSAWQRYFFKRRLRCSISGNAMYQLGGDRGSFSLSPMATYYTKKNWRFETKADLNYAVLNQGDIWRTQLNPRFKVSVFRDFYISADEKRYNLDVVCFKDDNGNGQMEAHEFGISDIKVTIIPQQGKRTTKRPKAPSQLFSDYKGKMFFKKVSEGQYEIEVDKSNTKAEGYALKETSRQIIDLKQDMVVYIPFSKANVVRGKLKFDKSKFSRTAISLANIRVTATSITGEQFHVLTDKNGNYVFTLPESKSYTISINNPFLKQIKLKKQVFEVSFEKESEATVNFIFYEKKRTVNFD